MVLLDAAQWIMMALMGTQVSCIVACLGITAVAEAQVRDTLRKPAELPAVSVEVEAFKPARYNATTKFDEFYRRRARGVGIFLTREDIERSGKSEAVELLRGIAGIRVVREKRDQTPALQFARCSTSRLGAPSGMGAAATGSSSVAVFVNGLEVERRNAMELVGDFNATDIEAMEVYRGPSELPLASMGNACAAVFIWTRYSRGSVLKP